MSATPPLDSSLFAPVWGCCDYQGVNSGAARSAEEEFKAKAEASEAKEAAAKEKAAELDAKNDELRAEMRAAGYSEILKPQAGASCHGPRHSKAERVNRFT